MPWVKGDCRKGYTERESLSLSLCSWCHRKREKEREEEKESEIKSNDRWLICMACFDFLDEDKIAMRAISTYNPTFGQIIHYYIFIFSLSISIRKSSFGMLMYDV